MSSSFSNKENESSNPREFTIANDKLFFEASNNTFEGGIWVSDGTRDGTFNIAIVSLQGEGFGEILAVDDKIFFQTIPGRAGGGRISVSDGTQTGTFSISNLFSPISRPNFITTLDNKLLLRIGKSDIGKELWISDG
ncbi:MAG: hypothetical protein WBA39_34880, partial [Rivularia sp. (in: cyanobacteria)]